MTNEVELYQPDDHRPAATDSWVLVVEEIGSLAAKISSTPFVPEPMRGNGAAVAAAILTGRELGLGPMQSLNSINVIKGRPAVSAEAMRALIQQAGHQIMVTESSASRVIMKGRRRGEDSWSEVTWTVDDARRAGIAGGTNWKAYPRQMLIARATTELARTLFADVIHGLRAAEELADEIDQISPTGQPDGQSQTTVVQRKRGRPRKTPEPPPEQQNQPLEPPAEDTAPITRKRAPLPAKKTSPVRPREAADGPETPTESGPTVEEQQEEIRRLSEERRQLLNPDRPTGDKPQTPADPVTVSGRSKTPHLTAGQRGSIMMHFTRLDMAQDRDERLWWINRLLNLPPNTIESASQLTEYQASNLLSELEQFKDRDALEQILLQPTLDDDPEE